MPHTALANKCKISQKIVSGDGDAVAVAFTVTAAADAAVFKLSDCINEIKSRKNFLNNFLLKLK